MPRGQELVVRRLVQGAGLLLFAVWTGLPFYWIVVTAFKPNLLIYR
jgi:ABC-type glycerol-3-phosphate transport system permease component